MSEEFEALKNGRTLIPTPRWFIGLRAVQIIVSFVIVILAGIFIHDLYADPLGLAVVAGLFTWITALYAILTEHSAGCRSGYNTWAVLSLDFFLMILWLASLGANAAFRSTFVVPVTASCHNDGSAINGGQCTVFKRGAVATQAGLATLSAIAGVSTIMLLLFIATFAYVAHFFRLEWARLSAGYDAEKNSGAAAAAPAGVPGVPGAFVDYPQQPQPQGPQHHELTEQPLWSQQPQWEQAPQPAAYPPQAPAYDPYPAQNTAYDGAQGTWEQQSVTPLQTPHATPAPGQPYYPPQ